MSMSKLPLCQDLMWKIKNADIGPAMIALCQQLAKSSEAFCAGSLVFQLIYITHVHMQAAPASTPASTKMFLDCTSSDAI